MPNVSTPDRPAFIIGKVILSDDSPTWWPTSNTGQHFPNVAKDQFLEIKEFSQTYAMLEREPYRLGGHIEMRRHSPSGLCRFRQAVNDLS